MNLSHILAMTHRYLYILRAPAKLLEYMIWPIIDIGFFGLIALWGGSLCNDTNLVLIFVTALILWTTIIRANIEIAFNIKEELVDQNLENLIASPLTKQEWVSAMMLTGIIKSVAITFIGAFFGNLFFNVNVFSIGFSLFPFLLLCILSGWIIGFISASIIIYKGVKLEFMAWILIMGIGIVSSIFYPKQVLPHTLQIIASSLPMTYIFEGMRSLLINHDLPWRLWITSFLLNLLYLYLSLKFFYLVLEKSRNRGIGQHL